MRNGLVRNTANKEEITFNLFRSNEKIARYTLFILDMQPPAKVAGKYAAFICPQGRESEWLFATIEGRKKLLESAKHARLAIVVMSRGHEYKNLDEVQGELNESIKSFAPQPGVIDNKVIMTIYYYIYTY